MRGLTTNRSNLWQKSGLKGQKWSSLKRLSNQQRDSTVTEAGSDQSQAKGGGHASVTESRRHAEQARKREREREREGDIQWQPAQA